LPPETALAETLFYRALGFVDADFNLREFYSGFLSDQVAGYYDTQAKTMNTILLTGDELGDELPFLEQIIYAHEFTHALQDQHFDLEGLFTQTSDNADQSLALTALIEGDATYMMQAFTFYLVSDNTSNIFALLNDSLSALGGSTMPLDTPPIFLAEVNFAYFEGMNFNSHIQQRAGWAGVNGVYENLPQSTEHILHPQKYIDGETPIAVSIADLQPIFGDDWQLAVTRTVGEFYLREYLKLVLPIRTANTASSGWGGDSLMIYHHPETNDIAWVMRIAWDTPADETEFITDYRTFLETRFGIAPDDDFCVASSQHAICVSRHDNQTLITFAPNRDLAVEMLNMSVMAD
jgi:hypothetical protein